VPGIIWLGGTLALLGIGILRLWRSAEFPWLAIMGALDLNLILTPHLVEYDLVMLLVPLLWLGANWLRSAWGGWGWMILVWMPWLSWLVVMAMTGRIELWWTAIWQLYPSLLLVVSLLWIGWERFLCQAA
ncbi:MAG: hypothetical protein KGJ80_17125, partial [Chloroflexota bacterium]|nr:hypothetical protein [Chloroflexota bacterium]